MKDGVIIIEKVGYIYRENESSVYTDQLVKLQAYGCRRIILGADCMSPKSMDEAFKSIQEQLSSGDQLVVCDLSRLGQTIIQLAKSIPVLIEKGIELVDLSDTIGIDNQMLHSFILYLAKMEHKMVHERVKYGIEKARSKGKVIGRPPISEEIANKICYLFKQKKWKLREIAEDCQVSLGTVSKYTKLC